MEAAAAEDRVGVDELRLNGESGSEESARRTRASLSLAVPCAFEITCALTARAVCTQIHQRLHLGLDGGRLTQSL